MKIKYVFSGIVILCLFTVVNIVKNNQENKDVLNLTLNHLEGLANEEIEGDEMKKATAYVCYFTKRYYDENTNSIIEKSVEGRVGICDGDAGPCNSWSCIEKL
ncbi:MULTISPECIES: hypothetical protein [Bacteroides]|uniref:hypothetical protein n=1 Tax=Bacteroides TaxID=816 RepID=UPI000C77230D|nr:MULTISPECIES: hypothetical protein [Bacteroides]RGM50247.1 hypothetical protein DXC10_02960 [Bacteroides sp. OM08-11]